MKKLMTFFVIGLLLLPMSSWTFDETPSTFKEFENWPSTQKVAILSDGWLKVISIGQAEAFYFDDTAPPGEIYYKKGIGNFYLVGSGYHLGNGYILTAAHVIIPSKVEIKINSAFSWNVPIHRITKRMFSVGGYAAALEWVSIECDIALLKIDLKLCPGIKDYGYKTYWTYLDTQNLIHPNDAVAVISFVRDEKGERSWHNKVTYGKIISEPKVGSCFFLIDIISLPGDSGLPIFAFQGGVPVIIGVVQAIFAYQGKVYTLAGRIDYVHRVMLERK